MDREDFDKLIAELKELATSLDGNRLIGIVGYTPTALDILSHLRSYQLDSRLAGIYSPHVAELGRSLELPKPIASLRDDQPSIVVIASDREKESLLEIAAPFLDPHTKIVVSGYRHFAYRDRIFQEATSNPLVASLANGYSNSLIHIYQCLQNAARLNLSGIVAEFGMFKGGTTMLISKFIELLGKDWKVYGFDTFGGFPEPRSCLDMYRHPECVFKDENSVRNLFSSRNVEIVAGDILETASKMNGQDIVLAFVDTDNFSPAVAVLNAIQDSVVVGGAIVFDHFTGHNRFVYTLGERLAAKRLLQDSRYFNLHGTGVFLRQR